MNHLLYRTLDKLLSFTDRQYEKLQTMADNRSKRKRLWILVSLLCFGIILFLNVLTPMIADDFAYLYIFGEKEQVSNLSELIRSQVTHYNLWGGRTVVHFVAQILLQMPHYVVDVVNSLVYLLFVFLIYKHIKGRNKENSIALFILINLAVWFVIPMFGDTILWITGSANYLWGTTIILLFLLPYRLYEGRGCSAVQKIAFSVLMFVSGVIAGWTNENTVGGMIIIIILFFTFYRSQGWKIPIQHILGLLGVLAGYIIMIKAPGNFVRGHDSIDLSLFVVLYRFFNHTQTLFIDYGLLIIVYLILIVLYNRFSEKKNLPDLYISFIYAIGGLAAVYAMIFSPQFPARAWFGIVTFLLISLGVILYKLNYNELFIRKMRDAVILIGCITFLFSLYSATKDIYRINKIDKEREILAREAREAGAEKCYFRMIVPKTKYVHGEDSETHLQLSYYYGIYIDFEK